MLVIVFNKKEVVKVDLQNMRKQAAKVEKLIFNFGDFLVKMVKMEDAKKSTVFF